MLTNSILQNLSPKKIERDATKATLKNYDKAGIDPETRKVKEGYYRLKDNRVISLLELYPHFAPTIEHTPQDTPKTDELRDYSKSIGLDVNGEVRKGFIKLQSGKVVTLREYNNIIG